MKKIGNALITAIFLGAAVYLVFFKESRPIYAIIFADSPVRRLSDFVEMHVDRIFSPLHANETVMPTQELRRIRETMRDLSASAPQDERQLYTCGIMLCDRLLQAIHERETHCKRLADCQAKRPVSLSRVSEQKDDIDRKWHFFQRAIHLSWESRAAQSRLEIDRLYSRMRLLERMP